MSSFVTFVIPTIGRATLVDAVQSLQKQTDPDWFCHIEGDGIDPTISLPTSIVAGEPRVLSWTESRHYHESDMRNLGIARSSSEWIGFLDDDDELASNYVKWLRQESASYDVVIFRQTLPRNEDRDDTVFPSRPEIVWGNVGISYAIRRNWALRFPFKRTKHEDLLQLVAVEAAGAKIHFSNHIAYYGRGHRG